MHEDFNFSGVIAPVVTPLGDDGAPDAQRFVEHCEWLMNEGCTALLPFGTTSEANSLGLDERLELLEELVDAGITNPDAFMVGTGACSVTDTVILTQHAMDLECGGVLVLPPFYYKKPSDEGLFQFYAKVIEGVGDDNLRLYLYHIPGFSGVGFSLELINRLVNEFPGIVVGMKDSSGDWENMKTVLEAKIPAFEFFPGSEEYMLDALRLGAAGSINAYANLNAGLQRELYDNWQGSHAEQMQAQISAFRKGMSAFPMIEGIKGLISHYRDDEAWARVRPPLIDMTPKEVDTIVQTMARDHEFNMVITIEV